MSLYDCRNKITAIIDRGVWKSSWHLPKKENGDTDWFSAETEERVSALLVSALDEGQTLVHEASLLLRQIGGPK